MGAVNFFLDSGAYSAWTRGVKIDIDEYIEFIRNHLEYIDVYAVLDDLEDAEVSYKNWEYMRRKGLKPLPVFHAHAPKKYLEIYIRETNYIAIGAIAKMSTIDRLRHLDGLWDYYLTDKDGYPIVKTHGFGLTSLTIMSRYPWYSVDSTSWILMAAYGSIYVPRFVGGKWQYDSTPLGIVVSNMSPSIKDEGRHFTTLSKRGQEVVLSYLSLKGYCLGRSEVREEPNNYKLKDGERWSGNVLSETTREVEVVVEEGLCNSSSQRAELNVLYFKDFVGTLPNWKERRFIPMYRRLEILGGRR